MTVAQTLRLGMIDANTANVVESFLLTENNISISDVVVIERMNDMTMIRYNNKEGQDDLFVGAVYSEDGTILETFTDFRYHITTVDELHGDEDDDMVIGLEGGGSIVTTY